MIKKLTEKDFDQIFRIMEQSFPVDEYRPREKQRALFAEKNYEVWGANDGQGALLGFLAFWRLSDCIFLEHFAVEPKERNRGLGARLLREVLSCLEGTICLEAEPPEDEIKRRRIAFYERNGFVLNTYPYQQPAFSPEKKPVPLQVMTYRTGLQEGEFESLRRVVYREVYGR